MIKVLRTLDDGEVAPDVIETDTAYYVVKLNQKNDEEATETKKESIISTREQDLYTETTDKWMEDADIKEEKKVLKTLKVTDNHKYNQPTATPEPTIPAINEYISSMLSLMPLRMLLTISQARGVGNARSSLPESNPIR